MRLLINSNFSRNLRRLIPSRVFLGLIVSLIISFCFLSNTAEAHRPAFPDGFNKSPNSAFQLDDIDISQAIYQILNKNEQVWLSFDPKSSSTKTANIQLGVPVLKESESFRPMVAIIGQNMDKIDLPFDIPEGFGAILYESNAEQPAKKFHEPFTNTDSWILIEEDFKITERGTHYVVIFSKTNQTGKFWFATGTKEVFDFSAISDLNKNISKVKTFHKPSISSSDKTTPQDKELGWLTRLQTITYFKSFNIYLITVLILLLLMFILVKKKTTPK